LLSDSLVLLSEFATDAELGILSPFAMTPELDVNIIAIKPLEGKYPA
jgi:hypothetical protein